MLIKGDELKPEFYMSWSHNELVSEIIKLKSCSNPVISKNIKSKDKILKFEEYEHRTFALKIAYFGWNYKGLACQDNCSNTIEGELFNAFHKLKLWNVNVKNPITEYKFTKCGRTDATVSAFEQVISCSMRCNRKIGNDFSIEDKNSQDEKMILFYVNNILPTDIKITAWSPVEEVNARSDCTSRTYKYLFTNGNLNISLMKFACQYFIGSHDFRNFCKVSLGNKKSSLVRKIYHMNVERRVFDGIETFIMTVEANGFLWNQIRHIAAILEMVGEEKEKPEIVKELLDINFYKDKPQYNIASGIPLVLYECQFGDQINWIYSHKNTCNIIKTWKKKILFDFKCKYLMSYLFLEELQNKFDAEGENSKHTPIALRNICSSHSKIISIMLSENT